MTIHKATWDELIKVAEVLGEAFREDPVMTWVRSGRGDPADYFIRVLRGLYFAHGEVYLAPPDRGAAIWLPPGISPAMPAGPTLGLAWRMLRSSGLKTVSRAFRVMEATKALRPAVPHYYLHAIGVSAAGRGRGLGSTLLCHVLDKADAQGLPVYLENSNPANLRLYQRHGFTVQRELQVSDSPPLWAMVREPRGADKAGASD